ncbi:beta-ketoacyl synthase N-terminal-like domain-containing protein [Streptomyces sp. NPDC026206]|uniref:beta-ketoacyl synthase N-terminal-like domain-containing protein n=1 Tax=Streptomyces sp. NPDC026206 TaxID=3157089 RepID=UPI0033D18C8B
MPVTTASDDDGTAIAIVGLGGLYPGAATIERFWDNIVHGVDSLREVPDTHWSVADHYDPDPAAPDKTYCTRGGFLPEVPFDPLEFGLPPKTLEYTDVLQLLSLLVARDTLADAGCTDAEWHDRSRTGVVLGVTGSNSIIQPLSTRLQTPVLKKAVRSCGLTERDAEEIADRFAKAFVPWEENAFPGLLGNVVAGRIANRFDLGGINCTVDAACASSLAAVRMAVDELLSGRADLMLTGGCDADNSILMYLCFSKTPALSRSGRIRPFDEDGDGTLIGEGIGMLALKRLADAERDGNRVYAVLRGLGASSDGRHKSIYAPRGEGQMTALERAYADAGFGPAQIGLLEAHGTGTPVGDLTELTALRGVYERAAAGRHSVAIGSVKSQIGHTKGAAGAAGLIKLALSLHHKVLPPTINVSRPRAALGFDDGPFYVNTECRPWIAEPRRPLRRAAVSSFGFGGTNFHCVLEEHSRAAGAPAARHATAQVYLWHAGTPAELVAAMTGPPCQDAAEPDRARLAIVARGAGELARLRTDALARLRADLAAEVFELDDRVFYRRRGGPPGKTAALFAGQGSQYVGMGARTALAVPQVRAAFDEAAAALGEAEPLGPVVFPPPAFDAAGRTAQENALRRTDYAQPAIGALSVGQYRYLAELGFVADAALGHSFGELTALWAAGSLTGEDFHRLAAARGRAMARRPAELPDPGTMAVVHAGAARVAELLAGHQEVVVCGLNAPAQVAVGGGTEAVGEFLAHCAAEGVPAQGLPVAAAFHTRHVAHAAGEFADALSRTDLRPPRLPVHANTEGAQYGADPEANRKVLAGQLTHPVHFAPRLEQLYAEGFRVFVEFGPKPVLAGLARQTLADRPDVTVLHADPGPGRDGDVALKQLVARLAVIGAPLKDFTPAAPTATTAADDAARKGMTIPLSGTNHVPAERRRAYQDALDNGYTVRPAPDPAAEASGGTGHLALHRDFLAGQFRIAERISEALREEMHHGVRDSVLAALATLAEHSVAICRSHEEALRSLAHLEPGPPAPTPLPAQLPEAEAEAEAGSGPDAVAAALPPVRPRPLLAAVTSAPPVPPEAAQPPPPYAPAPPPAAAPEPGGPDGVAVREQLLDIVSAKTGYPAEMLDGGMEIEADLGIDSIKRVEIMGTLRERFPATAVVGAETLAELRSLDDIVEFVTGAQEGGGHPKAERGPGVARHHARPVPLTAPDRLEGAYRDKPVALLAGGAQEPARTLGERLTAAGWTVHRGDDVPAGVDRLDLVLYAPQRPDGLGAASALLREALLLCGRAQPLLEAAARHGRAAFVTVVAASAEPAAAALGGLAGLVRTLAIEAPTLFCRAVELDAALDAPTAAALVLAELHDPREGLGQVRYDAAAGRHRTVLTGRGPGPAAGIPEPGPGDLLVVTGGGRGVTAACAVALARRHRAGLLLLGRTRLTAEHDWAADVPAGRLRAAVAHRAREAGATVLPRDVERVHRDILAQREVGATLLAARQADAEVAYLPVDVTDAEAVATALRPHREHITGVVHGAGVLADQLITDKRAEDIDRVLGPKLLGLEAVLAAVDTGRLRHLVLFSSVAGFFGNRGQADYAMANEALNHLAVALKDAHPAARVTALNWGAWEGGMVTPELARLFTERGIPLIPLGTGAELFVEQFDRRRGEDTVCVIGPDTPLSAPPARRELPGGGVSVRRDAASLLTGPVLADHRVDGTPVLPLTALLGAVLDVAGQILPTTPVTAVRDITVFKGVVDDRDRPAALVFAFTPHPQGGVRVTVRDEKARPRYGAVLDTGDPAAPPPRQRAVPAFDGGEAIDPYADGALFHGPALRGIRRLLADDGQDMTFLCELADSRLGDGNCATPRHSPVLSDQLLQAPLVWLHRRKGVRALPSRIGRFTAHRPLPSGAPFAVSVEDVRPTAAGARCSVVATDARGEVLAELHDVELVERPAPVVWGREDLLELATGSVAKVYGPAFAEADALPRRLRLPGPPYLVLSRVTALRATTGVLEPSGITVEYDVPDDAFAVDGRAALCTTLEAAQASVVLIGYMGVDLQDKGRRRYRLLGGSTVFHGDLPRAGETVRYELEISRLVRQDDKLLFFFDCRGYRGTALFLEMLDNCAGFFTDAELADPLGIVPTRLDERRRQEMTRAVFTPLARTGRTELTRADLELLAAGDPAAVFGPAWDRTADALNPSVRLPAGQALMLDAVTGIDRTGGPRALGRLTATRRVTPDDWYFRCHFPDDPVMPGTLMLEGAAQLLQVYALSLGLHLVFPDAEFQPAPGQRTHCTLRGQVGPGTSELRYVADVTGITMLPRPTVVADVMVHDGDKPILSLRDLAVQVREKPGTPCRIEKGGRPARLLGRRNAAGEPALANELHLAHLAQGDLSLAMGPEFAVYRGRQAPRIPNGDFRFVDRIMEFTGERGQLSGARMITEYDSPPDAWYYEDPAQPGMPYCVLQESSLQSAVLTGYYLGASLLTPDEDLVIRNLDGTAVLLREADLRGRTIRQESELLSTRQIPGATLQTFRYRLSADGEDFYRGESLFGYFNAGTLAKQAGLDGGKRVPPWQAGPGAAVERAAAAGTAGDRLRLVDHVDIVRDGGRHGLGHVRAHRPIDAGDWYFPCHFHGDPVMPGSLGVEAALRALREFAARTGAAAGPGPVTFTLPVGVPMTWRYRGQILPHDRELVLDLHIKEIRDASLVIADGSVWNGALRIYEFTDLAVATHLGER